MFVFILLVFLLYSQEFHSPECCRFCNGSHKCGQWGLITDHVVIPWKVCGWSALIPGGVEGRCPCWIQKTPVESWVLWLAQCVILEESFHFSEPQFPPQPTHTPPGAEVRVKIWKLWVWCSFTDIIVLHQWGPASVHSWLKAFQWLLVTLRIYCAVFTMSCWALCGFVPMLLFDFISCLFPYIPASVATVGFRQVLLFCLGDFTFQVSSVLSDLCVPAS